MREAGRSDNETDGDKTNHCRPLSRCSPPTNGENNSTARRKSRDPPNSSPLLLQAVNTTDHPSATHPRPSTSTRHTSTHPAYNQDPDAPHLPSAPYVYTSVTIGPRQGKGHYLRDYNSLYNGSQGHVPGIYIQEQDPAIYTSRHICDLFLSLRVGFFSTCQMAGGLHRVPPQQGSQPILSRVIEPALGLVASSIGGGPLACWFVLLGL